MPSAKAPGGPHASGTGSAQPILLTGATSDAQGNEPILSSGATGAVSGAPQPILGAPKPRARPAPSLLEGEEGEGQILSPIQHAHVNLVDHPMHPSKCVSVVASTHGMLCCKQSNSHLAPGQTRKNVLGHRCRPYTRCSVITLACLSINLNLNGTKCLKHFPLHSAMLASPFWQAAAATHWSFNQRGRYGWEITQSHIFPSLP